MITERGTHRRNDTSKPTNHVGWLPKYNTSRREYGRRANSCQRVINRPAVGSGPDMGLIMIIRISSIALLLLSCSACDSAAASHKAQTINEKPYDFKGIPLEISLSDFRALSHPDGNKAKIICTGEKDEPADIMLFDATDQSVGMVKCKWIGVGETIMSDADGSVALSDTGYAMYDYSFNFIRDPVDGVTKLYEFEGTTNVDAMTGTVKALSEKWGKPIIVRGSVQNQIGGTFNQTTATWKNSKSQIVVMDRWSKIDDMGVRVIDTRLNNVIEHAKSTAHAALKNGV